MPRRDTAIVPFDPEITRTERRIRAKLKRLKAMEGERGANAVNARDGVEQQVEYDENGIPIPRDPVNNEQPPPPPPPPPPRVPQRQ